MPFRGVTSPSDYLPVEYEGEYSLPEELSRTHDLLWAEFKKDPLAFISRLEKKLHERYTLLPRKRYVSRYYNSHSGRWIRLGEDEAVLLATVSYESGVERDRHHHPIRGVSRRVDLVYKREGFYKVREERYWSHEPGENTRIVFSVFPVSIEEILRLLNRNPRLRREFFDTLVAYSSREYERKREIEEEHEIVYLLSQIL